MSANKEIFFAAMWAEEIVPDEVYLIFSEKGVYKLFRTGEYFEFEGEFFWSQFSKPFYAMTFLHLEHHRKDR